MGRANARNSTKFTRPMTRSPWQFLAAAAYESAHPRRRRARSDGECDTDVGKRLVVRTLYLSRS